METPTPAIMANRARTQLKVVPPRKPRVKIDLSIGNRVEAAVRDQLISPQFKRELAKARDAVHAAPARLRKSVANQDLKGLVLDIRDSIVVPKVHEPLYRVYEEAGEGTVLPVYWENIPYFVSKGENEMLTRRLNAHYKWALQTVEHWLRYHSSTQEGYKHHANMAQLLLDESYDWVAHAYGKHHTPQWWDMASDKTQWMIDRVI